MVICVLSDCQTTTGRLRHFLAQGGHDCPLRNGLTISAGLNEIAAGQLKPDVVVFVTPHDSERSPTSIRKLRESVSSHIIAIGPRDSSIILCAFQAGANDYLDEASDLASELAAAFARTTASLQKRAPLGQFTTVVAASGGSGRTLVATNLAVCLAKANVRCGLFDLDSRGSDVATFLGLKPRHTIADLCRNIDKLDLRMWEQSVLDQESGVSVLAGPPTWEEARHVTLERTQKVIRFGRSLLPHVVGDLDSAWMSDRSAILLDSTAVLLLFRLDFAAVRNATRAVQFLNKIGVESSKLQLIVTRYGENKAITAAQAEAVLGMPIRHFVPDDPQIVNACINFGVPVVAESPRSVFAKAIGSIAESLNGPLAPVAQTVAERAVEAKRALPVVDSIRSFINLSLREFALRPQ
jgi:pilus assembly protein CpaE